MSDASVARMTDGQWLFEYHALQMKEQAQQRQWASMLGLNIFAQDEEGPLTPLAMLCGTPELLGKLSEDADTESGVQDALNDPEFDEWADALARGEYDTDLEPVPDDAQPLINFGRSPKIEFDED